MKRMRREEKYPDTSTFHYFNRNPKGRITGDCLYRALATAMDEKPGETTTQYNYNAAVMVCAESHCKTGYETSGRGEEIVLESLGFSKRKQPRKKDGTKYTAKEFCEYLTKFEKNHGRKLYCHVGGNHCACIAWYGDGFKVLDIWNSTYKCVGNYWERL